MHKAECLACKRKILRWTEKNAKKLQKKHSKNNTRTESKYQQQGLNKKKIKKKERERKGKNAWRKR